MPKTHRKSQKAAASSPSFDAAGDEPLSIPSLLKLDQPFRLNRDLIQRLRRRASLPHFRPPTPLDSFLVPPTFTAAQCCLFLDDRSAPAPLDVKSPKNIVLIVGPEGGFSDPERAKLSAKAQPLVLGGRIL